MVRGDSLHILYSRGVASHLAGSLLHYMCLYDYPKRQSVPASQRLENFFAKIKDLYSANKVAARLTNLRLSMLCDTQKPHKNFACLEAKAAETKHFYLAWRKWSKKFWTLRKTPFTAPCWSASTPWTSSSSTSIALELSSLHPSTALYRTLPKGSLMPTMTCTIGPCQKAETFFTLCTNSTLAGICSTTPSFSISELITTFEQKICRATESTWPQLLLWCQSNQATWQNCSEMENPSSFAVNQTWLWLCSGGWSLTKGSAITPFLTKEMCCLLGLPIIEKKEWIG